MGVRGRCSLEVGGNLLGSSTGQFGGDCNGEMGFGDTCPVVWSSPTVNRCQETWNTPISKSQESQSAVRAAWCLRELVLKFPLYSAGEMLVLKGKRREPSRGKTEKKIQWCENCKGLAIIRKYLWSDRLGGRVMVVTWRARYERHSKEQRSPWTSKVPSKHYSWHGCSHNKHQGLEPMRSSKAFPHMRQTWSWQSLLF